MVRVRRAHFSSSSTVVLHELIHDQCSSSSCHAAAPVASVAPRVTSTPAPAASYTTGYVSAAPAPIVEYVQPSLQTVAQAPIVAGPASVVEYVPQAPVYEYVQPTPFFQTAVLAPIFGYQFAPTQQLVYGPHQVPYCDHHKEAEGCLLLNVLPLVVRIHHAALSYVVWTSAVLS